MKKYFSFFQRLMISHIVVIMIPVLAVLGYYYPKLNKAIEEQAVLDSHNKLTSIQQSIDMNFEDMLKTYVSISDNPKLSSFYLDDGPLNRMEGKTSLSSYISSNKFLEDIFIFIRDNDMILNKSGILYLNKDYFEFSGWSFDQLRHDMTSTEKITLRPVDTFRFNNGQAEKLLAIIMPTNYLSDTSNVFLISEKTFVDIFKLSAGDYDYDYYLYNENQLLLSHVNKKNLDNEIQYLLSKDASERSEIVTIDGIDYIFTVKSDGLFPVSYVSLLPYQTFFRNVEKLQMESLILVISLLLLGFLISYGLSKINYRPINALIELFNMDEEHDLEAYQLIQYNIKHLIDQNKTMSEKMDQSIPALQEFMIRQIINNQVTSIDEFNSIASHYGVSLRGQHFSIAVIKLKRNLDNQIIESLSEIKSTDLNGYFCRGMQKDSLIWLTSYDHLDDVKNYLRLISSYLSQELSLDCFIGVSTVFDAVDSLNIAYNQAIKVIEYQTLKSIEGIFYYDVLPPISNNTLYPAKLIVEFKKTLLVKDQKKTYKVYDKLIEHLNKEESPSAIKHLSYDMFNIMYSHLSDNEKNLLDADYFLREILAAHYGIDEIIKTLDETLDTITKKKSEDRQEELITSILVYINKHYSNYEISLSDVAGEFGMTPSNLSHYFKKQTKVNFVSYIKYLRIDEAKVLLETTDLSVGEISQNVGFYAVTSFNRTFKREVGLTPLQYRSKER
ncbi:response regulator transcription factor [Acidaminobacter sp. JC074]|uniref:response regulator transcription factor n=1 Tax=Acidaminobacter sp. JC074 TaxID=2530199 RepID=UPI001F0DBDE3|nr:response regulator transcription factor [Acidaminobacter sp. JC074]